MEKLVVSDTTCVILYSTKTDADDLNAQASALSLRNSSTAVAKVLGSAAGKSDLKKS